MPQLDIEVPKSSKVTREIKKLLASISRAFNALICPECGFVEEATAEGRVCQHCGTEMSQAILNKDEKGEADYEKHSSGYELVDDMIVVKDVPILNTGYWNMRRFDKGHLVNMVEEWEGKQKDLVCDHVDYASTLWGVARKPKLVEHDGIYTIAANLLITKKEAIELLLSLEKVGKKLQISPRVTYELDEGKEVNPRITHVSVVLRGAQGNAAELEKEEKMSKAGVMEIELEDEDDPKKKEEEDEAAKKKKKEEEEGEEEAAKEKEDGEEEGEEEEGEEEEKKAKKKKEEEGEEEVNTDNEAVIDGIDQLMREIGQVLSDPEATPEAIKSFLLKISEFLAGFKKEKKEKPEEEEPPDKEEPEDKYPTIKGSVEKAISAVSIKTRDAQEKLGENLYKKEILFPTMCVLPESRNWDAQVAVNIDEPLIDAVIKNFAKLGGRVPVFVGHVPIGEEDKHLEKAIGWITELAKEDGRLFASKLGITNERIRERIDDTTLRDASIGLVFQYTTSEGVEIGPVLRHLAVTAQPLFKGMKGFEKLAASDTLPEGEVELEPIDTSSPQLKALQLELEETKEKMDRFAEQYSELSKTLLDARQEDLEKQLLGLVSKGVIKPAYKDSVKDLLKKASEADRSGNLKLAESFLEILGEGVVEADLSAPKIAASDAAQLSAENRHYFTGEELETEGFRKLYRKGLVDQDELCRPFCKTPDWEKN